MLKGKILHSIYDNAVDFYGRTNSVLSTRLGLSLLYPLVLRLRTSVRCNLSCTFCYQADSLNQKELNHLSLEEWNKILDPLPRHTIIDVTGGETFISKNFKPLIDLILEKKFRTSLITNGSYPNDEILENLVEKKLFYFMVSVDGLEEYHNRVRGNDQSFQNLCKTIDRLIYFKNKHNKKHPLICLKITITDDNHNEMEKVIDHFYSRFGITDFTLNLMFQNKVRGGNKVHKDFSHPDYQEGNTQKYDPTQFSEIIDSLAKIFKTAQDRQLSVKIKPDIKFSQIRAYLENPNSFGVKACHKSASILTLYYDGALTPCDIGLQIGNIRDCDYKISQAWKNQQYSALTKSLKTGFHPSCEGCCLKSHESKKFSGNLLG